MRREAAAVKIQKNVRRHKARESYLLLQAATVTLQTGLRAMSARKEFRFRKETKAAVHIQVRSVLIKLLLVIFFIFYEAFHGLTFIKFPKLHNSLPCLVNIKAAYNIPF